MPSEVRLAEVRRFLESHGYTLERISGSHHVFTRPAGPNVNFPVHSGRVQPVYIKQIKKKLGVKFW